MSSTTSIMTTATLTQENRPLLRDGLALPSSTKAVSRSPRRPPPRALEGIPIDQLPADVPLGRTRSRSRGLASPAIAAATQDRPSVTPRPVKRKRATDGQASDKVPAPPKRAKTKPKRYVASSTWS